ncbi:hypothetical protein [Streptomyces aureoverticillatus]|uniref:hypothetical protein n=1 Tax=Streptomyces aureoverticillatus TaxID=66871 RepID=UPI0013DC53B0|nr:hypothetical protein [Streptomyces aureoverticillatus]QIB44486.1 hypothetical protein G3H79_16750 [Streptomyces aureoverticillatus]
MAPWWINKAQGAEFCMTSQVGVGGLRIAKALSYVCGHRDELVALLDEDVTALRAVEAVVGRPPVDDVSLTALLDALHAAVRRAGDSSGVYGAVGRSVMSAGVADLDVVYRCPLQLCIGRSAHEVDGEEPRCQFAPGAMALIRERLP